MDYIPTETDFETVDFLTEKIKWFAKDYNGHVTGYLAKPVRVGSEYIYEDKDYKLDYYSDIDKKFSGFLANYYWEDGAISREYILKEWKIQ